MILAHNHPSGDVEPTNADKTFTTMMIDAGKLFDVKVIDQSLLAVREGISAFLNLA